MLLATAPLFSQASLKINCLKTIELLTYVPADIVSFKLFYHYLGIFTFNQKSTETKIIYISYEKENIKESVVECTDIMKFLVYYDSLMTIKNVIEICERILGTSFTH